jgi:hypothetical protein
MTLPGVGGPYRLHHGGVICDLRMRLLLNPSRPFSTVHHRIRIEKAGFLIVSVPIGFEFENFMPTFLGFQ